MATENTLAEPGANGKESTWRVSVLAVVCLGLYIVFFDLNGYRTLTKHEGFVAVVSREMLETGDWIVPRFGGLPRLKKPPLSYWSAATTSWVFGVHEPWTARFPFAVSALVLAGLVGYWAGTWYGRWQGLAAALVQISSVYVISFSRKAEVDMLLCLLTTSALFLVVNAPRDENKKSAAFRWMGIYTLVGLAWLAKFHYGPAMVMGVIGVWHLVERRWPRFWDVFNPIGWLIFAACLLVWPYLLLQRVPEAWAIWQAETVGRALGDLGREPFWFYLPQVVILALPWSLLLWPAGKSSWTIAWKQSDSRERFLWVWFVTQFAILTASAFKHHHYLMAAMPALSLILGRQLVATWQDVREGRFVIGRKLGVVFMFGSLALGIGAAIGVTHRWPHLQSAATMLGICLAVAGLIVGLCLMRRRWTSGLVAAGCGFVISYGIITAAIFPNRDSRLAAARMATEIREQIPEQEPICVFGLKEDPIVYYLPGPVYRSESIDELENAMQSRGRLELITSSSQMQALSELPYKVTPLSEPLKKSGLLRVRLTGRAIATAGSPNRRD